MPTTTNLTRIRRLRPADAEALVSCFQRCYGNTYPSSDFYSAATLRRRISTGTLRSVVAVDQLGRLVGHTGLTVPPGRLGAPPPRVAIAGNTVVAPEARGQGVFGRLVAALSELTRDEGLVGYVHFPTTAHTIVQEHSVQRNGVETGILLAYMPAETNYRDIRRDTLQGSVRLATTVVYQPFSPAPSRNVVLPRRYRELLSKLYRRARLDRTVVPAGEVEDHDETSLHVETDERRGVLHVAVEQIGSELERELRDALDTHPASVVHVDLHLDDTRVDAAVEVLRRLGFLYCALLPELRHTDVLRLQRIEAASGRHETQSHDESSFQVHLANAGAKELLELMRRELQPQRAC